MLTCSLPLAGNSDARSGPGWESLIWLRDSFGWGTAAEIRWCGCGKRGHNDRVSRSRARPESGYFSGDVLSWLRPPSVVIRENQPAGG